MQIDELLARAREMRDHANALEQRARDLQQASSLRAQAAQMVAQASQLEGPVTDDGDQQAAAATATPAPEASPETIHGWPAHLFVNPYQQAQ